MRVVYLHLPRFPLQRRIWETPSLHGAPVVLWEEVRGQRRVVFASAAAARRGCAPGMTATAAAALLPELKAFPYEPEVEEAALLSLGEALMAVAPGFQLAAPEGMWLDGSAASLAGGEKGLCARAEEIARQHGYRGRAVIASDLFTARAVARHRPPGEAWVARQESAAQLRPLPLRALEDLAPMAARSFSALGLTTLGEVAALPAGAVVARLGAEGLRAQRLCRGEDDALFLPAALPEVLEESLSLDWPAESSEPLLFGLKTLFDRLCARLSGRGRAAVRLQLSLRLDPTGEVSLPLVLARPSAQPKLLLDLARHRISDLTLERPVGGLRARVEASCEDRGRQMALGDSRRQDEALEVVLSRLQSALGEDALFAGEAIPSHRPEAAYRQAAFHPPRGGPGELGDAGARLNREPQGRARLAGGRERRAEEAAALEAGVGLCAADRPPRLFPRPCSLEAEVGEEGQIRAARLLGKRRRATAVAGPERLCGDWWESGAAYLRDYYRVHFEGLGAAWVYRDGDDGRFYLHGMFD